MQNDASASHLNAPLATELTPAPPPVMPHVRPAALAPPAPMPTSAPPKAMPAGAGTVAPASAPAPSGWEVDPQRMSYFTRAVEDARDRLRDVQAKVERMQAAGFTPRLGTSPAGQQLEKKFADRLDAPLDNPANPTTGGLRALLAEAMRRMEEFVAGAEAAAKSYTEHEVSTTAEVSKSGQSTGSAPGH